MAHITPRKQCKDLQGSSGTKRKSCKTGNHKPWTRKQTASTATGQLRLPAREVYHDARQTQMECLHRCSIVPPHRWRHVLIVHVSKIKIDWDLNARVLPKLKLIIANFARIICPG